MKSEMIMAYVDGELTPEEVLQVEAELRQNVRLQRMLAGLCRQEFLYVENHLRQKAASPFEFPGSNPTPFLPPLRNQSPKSHFSKTSWALLAASVLIFLFLNFNNRSAPSISEKQTMAVLRECSQGVQILREDRSQAVSPFMELKRGDVIQVSQSGSAILQYMDGSLVKVYPGSWFEMGTLSAQPKEPENLKHLGFLGTGRLWVRIQRQNPGQPVWFLTPDGSVEVMGTEFQLNTHARQGTVLRMVEGKVRMIRNSDQKAVELSGSEWAQISTKDSFVSRQGTPGIFKRGKPLLENAFDSRLSQWTFDQARGSPMMTEQESVHGMKVQSTGDGMGKAFIRLPSPDSLPFKSYGVEFENMNESEFFFLCLAKKSIPLHFAPEPHGFARRLDYKTGRWYVFRMEMDAVTDGDGKRLFHVVVYRDKTLLCDGWLEENPEALELDFQQGRMNVRNLKIFELVPDTF